ncbi:MAG: hypothetical protein ACK4ZX_09630, partial [Thermus sp.]
MHLEEAQNGKKEIPRNLAPKTRALVARIEALIRERQAMGGVADAPAGEQGEAPPAPSALTPPETAPDPSPGLAPSLGTTPAPPPAPSPSGAAREGGPEKLRRFVEEILSRPLKGEVPPPRYTPSLASLVEEALDRYDLGLSPAERYVYASMLTAGLYRLKLQEKPITKSMRQVVLFVPVDSLAATLGIARRTLSNILNNLEERGLVAGRAWVTKATVHGKTGVYRAGAVFAIRLPNRDGRARIYPEDLQHPWRDLEADIEAGRTAWAELQARREEEGGRRTRRRPWEGMSSFAESIFHPLRDGSTRLESLLKWSLSPGFRLKGLLDLDSAKPAAERLLGLLAQAKSPVRRRLVEEMALGLAKEFRDPGSTRFYAWAIWHAFRAD